MDVLKIIVCLLVAAGAVIMAANIRRYPVVMRERAICDSKETHGLLVFFRAHYILMLFFLIGYLVVLVSLVTGVNLISELLLGIIFLSGALFVMLGIVLQDRMLQTLRKRYIQAIKMLVSAVEIRDPYTIGHSEHVANLAMLIVDALSPGMKNDVNQNLVGNAGLLHDIGKIGVPEEVLNKTGKLNEDEFRIIRQHAAIGRSLVGNMECMDDIAKWIEYHHERVDGKGYYEVAAVDIPLVSKVLAIADTYSALVTDRPYREGKTHQEALGIIRANAGTQLDPRIVTVFTGLNRQLIEQCRPDSLVIEYLDELRKVETYARNPQLGHGLDMVLHEDLGVLCLQKIFDYCAKQDARLSLATLKINGLNRIEKLQGYHEVDELSSKLSDTLFANIRRTDFIIRSRRDYFVLAFPECPLIQSMKLLKRIQHEIENAPWIPKNQGISIEKEFVEFQPADFKSEYKIEAFLGKLSPKQSGSRNFQNFTRTPPRKSASDAITTPAVDI